MKIEKVYEEMLDHLYDLDRHELKELAEEAGVSPHTLKNWAYGKTLNPHINTLCKVARALGYEIHLKKASPSSLRLVS